MNRYRELRSTLPLILFLTLLSGCSGSWKAYPGPALPADQLATFKGYWTTCYGKLRMEDFDGAYTGTELQAPAGEHTMKVRSWGEPFNLEVNGRQDPYTICIWGSLFDVSFTTKARYVYSFNVKETPDTGIQLTVWESDQPGGVDAHQIPAQVTRTLQHRGCAPTMEFAGCPGF